MLISFDFFAVAVTLMSTDTELICRSFATLHEVWASPIECGLALYLLYRQLGLAFLAPMVVALGKIIIMYFQF